MSEPLRLFVGFDSKEPIAFHVFAHSLLRRASGPIAIVPLVQDSLRKAGTYTRERGPTESTEFSITRFLVPALCGFQGHAIFADCDMLARVDICTILDEIVGGPRECPPWAVMVCKHYYVPRTATKFLGQQQTAYPRKNWSSLVIFNNERCRMLTPNYVNAATGLELHRFLWLKDEEIGSLPLAWNYLVDEDGQDPNIAPKILHFTNGGPWFKAYVGCSYADEWRAELAAMVGDGR